MPKAKPVKAPQEQKKASSVQAPKTLVQKPKPRPFESQIPALRPRDAKVAGRRGKGR